MANEDIRCPYCATSISAALASCPSCGATIPGADTAIETVDRQASSPAVATPNMDEPVPEPVQPPPEQPSTAEPAPVDTKAPESVARRGTGKKSHLGMIIAVGIILLVAVPLAFEVVGTSSCFRGQAPDSPPIPLPFNFPLSGTIDSDRPLVVYELTVTKRGLVHIEVTGDFDTFLELYREGSDQPFHEDDDSAGGTDSRLVDVLEPGRYFVAVAPMYAWGSGDYRLTAISMEEPIPMEQAERGFPWPPSAQRNLHRHFQGVARQVTGGVNVEEGERCDVFVGQAEPGGFNCRVVIYCGDRLLYGRATAENRLGYIDCSMVPQPQGLPGIRAYDTGPTESTGDPIMELDSSAQRARVAERGSRGNWDVNIQLLSAEERARLDAAETGTP